MAGTPTPNYQFPTYAETDTPNLAGAYNQAVNAIDAKIKEVADSVSSGGDVPDATSTTKGIAKLYDSATVGAGDQDDGGITPKAVDDKIGDSLTGYAPKFTVAAPITYSGNQIGIRYSNPAADGTQNGYGAVQVTGKQSDVAAADSLTTATVPNVKAVKDYVDAKVPTEQLAYTGTYPITVNSGTRAISINDGRFLTSETVEAFISAMKSDQNAYIQYSGAALPLVDSRSVGRTVVSNNNASNNWPAARTVPTLGYVTNAITAATPDASTSTKGLVQLSTGNSVTSSTAVLTETALINEIKTIRNNMATQAVDVQTLAGKLFIDTQTGLVFYKPNA